MQKQSSIHTCTSQLTEKKTQTSNESLRKKPQRFPPLKTLGKLAYMRVTNEKLSVKNNPLNFFHGQLFTRFSRFGIIHLPIVYFLIAISVTSVFAYATLTYADAPIVFALISRLYHLCAQDSFRFPLYVRF